MPALLTPLRHFASFEVMHAADTAAGIASVSVPAAAKCRAIDWCR
jgi:hypothetical protein